jgi:hypothetical protein
MPHVRIDTGILGKCVSNAVSLASNASQKADSEFDQQSTIDCNCIEQEYDPAWAARRGIMGREEALKAGPT